MPVRNANHHATPKPCATAVGGGKTCGHKSGDHYGQPGTVKKRWCTICGSEACGNYTRPRVSGARRRGA